MAYRYQYTANNHLQLGSVVQPSSIKGAKSIPAIKIGACQQLPETGLQESISAAKLIRENLGPDIVLCMSGGIDSEAMAEAFIEAGIRFQVAIAEYGPNCLNYEDIHSAIRFCEDRAIKYVRIHIDLDDFFLNDKFLYYGREFGCRSPQLAVHLRLLELIRELNMGFPVLAWNPIEVLFNPSMPSPKILLPDEPHLVYLRFFAQLGIEGVPFFFAYTPEQIYSFWRTPQFNEDLNAVDLRFRNAELLYHQSNKIFGYAMGLEPWLYVSKVLKFEQAGFKCRTRDGKKTGFEKVKTHFREIMIYENKIERGFVGDVFNVFFREPLEKMNAHLGVHHQIIPAAYFPRPDLLANWAKP